MTLEELKGKVKGLLSQGRWEHTLRVARTALELAACLQLELEEGKIETAALLHDCAKDLPLGEQLKKAGYFGIVLTSSDLLCPKTIHGRVAAGIAQHEFGIRDPDILRAIALHTTGGPRMSALAKLILWQIILNRGVPSRVLKNYASWRKGTSMGQYWPAWSTPCFTCCGGGILSTPG